VGGALCWGGALAEKVLQPWVMHAGAGTPQRTAACGRPGLEKRKQAKKEQRKKTVTNKKQQQEGIKY